MARGIKALVVACNTASASALPALRERFPELPVIGVIEPGARAACEASASGRIAVLATEGTVQGGAYERAIQALRPDAQVTQVACQIFVALAEEGWSEGEAVDAVTERYLAHLDARVDTVVLGCTHFPLLTGSIVRQLGVTRRVVDSAATTARAGRESHWAMPRWRQLARARAPCSSWPPTARSVSRGWVRDSSALRSRSGRWKQSTFRHFP